MNKADENRKPAAADPQRMEPPAGQPPKTKKLEPNTNISITNEGTSCKGPLQGPQNPGSSKKQGRELGHGGNWATAGTGPGQDHNQRSSETLPARDTQEG